MKKTSGIVGNESGFTLVELVMTLVLIGIIGAVSAPRFFDKTKFDQYGFFNEVISSVRYAQKRAVASCSPVRITLSAGGYTLYRAAAAPATCGAAVCADPGTTNTLSDPSNPSQPFTRTAPGGVTLTAATIVFCPLGSTLGETDYTVNVTAVIDSVTTNKSFSVAGVTGFVY